MSGGLNAFRCAELARIVDGTPAFMDGVCLIQLLRADLSPTILGARSRSPLVLPVFFSVEARGERGRALNLGESVLRQEEANTVMRVLREQGICVTALHNHWLCEEPRLMYMHWEARMDPERFLRASKKALRAANIRTRPLAGEDDGERHRFDQDDEDDFHFDDDLSQSGDCLRCKEVHHDGGHRPSHRKHCCDGHRREEDRKECPCCGGRLRRCDCPACTRWQNHPATHLSWE